MRRTLLIAAAIVAAVALLNPLHGQNPVTIFFGTSPWSTAATGIPKVGITDSAGSTFTANSGRLPVLADINNGSATATDAATQSAGTSSVALVESFGLKYNGAAYARVVGDPCELNSAVYVLINQTAGTKLVTGTSSKKIYICAIQLITATAQNIALVEGTGTVCATGPAGVMGGSTAATGWNFAANGGLAMGNGASSIAAEATNADDLCLLQSGSGQVSGNVKYVVQ